ncbi:MAG: cob(I)yrinic acid a,c-diamide adenosyltransferase [Armatimonadota bacterium]
MDDWCKDWDIGRVQVYTGTGKGKTTAAFGLALRAAGAGMKTFIAQFVKGRHYSELDALATIDAITCRQYGRGCFIHGEPNEEDIRAAQEGLREAADILQSGDFDIVILDEANIATHFGLFTVEALIEAINSRAAHVEVVVTGRCADQRILDLADLVTDMQEVKHYFNDGVQARRGIEC